MCTNICQNRSLKQTPADSELGTLEWGISRSMLDPLFFLIILHLYPEKCIKSTNQSCVSEAGKFEILRAI